MKVNTQWKQEQEFTSNHEEQFVQMDGNRLKGISPKALLLAGLSGCSGIDVVAILSKMKMQFSQLQIDAVTEQTDENPKVFKDIHLLFSIHTAIENEEKVRKAIDLSLEKYCGVAAMLRKNSTINYSLIIL
ncbi:MAG: OsmC family peroxiredoxin [Chitinophagaceae bacterium]|nr:MAG: OsmC family peroxiredoxin [Chitinophagaceae bacterium]